MSLNVIYAVLILSVVCNICQFLYSGNLVTGEVGNVRRALTSGNNVVNGVVLQPGARKIFIDIGANDGASTNFFVNPSKADGNEGIASQGGGQGSIMQGMGSSGDWEIVMIEANQNFSSRLEYIKNDIMGRNLAKEITIYAGTAIAKTTGPITFIIDNPKSGETGATTMLESTSAVGPHFTIPGMGIVDLFHTMRIHHSDYVVLKMDVEGAEFELMRHIITHGLQTRIDILAVEYHDANYWVFGKTDAIRLKYKKLHECLDWMVEEIHGMKMMDWGR